mmetsp:Transcript_20142/g.26232  ORF Transcript_20142/g.26232 Transcript_20142/m.26232 type:complete len:140 (+) Transcript_20142:76-495(+)
MEESKRPQFKIADEEEEEEEAFWESDEEDEKVEPDEFYDNEEDDGIQKEINELNGSEHVGELRLSCPCCFTIVCNDCQRHARIKSQWRAMFVINCLVDSKTKIQNDEEVRSVSCGSCGAAVGVQDADEVYHFFGVIPSL